MVHRKNSQTLILEKGFEIFLKEGFSGTTLSKIEKATGKTRGAFFHFFRNKEDLFEQVIKTYILQTQSVEQKFDLLDNVSLMNFLKIYVNGIQNTMNRLLSLGEISYPYNRYLSLYLDAGKYMPDFVEQMKVIEEKELTLWKSVLNQAIEKKEIKEVNSALFADIFRSVFLGMGFGKSISDGLDVDHLYTCYMEIYKQIKL